MTDLFDDPGTAAALDMAELNGRLLLFKPHRVEVGVKTVHGPKNATVADVHVVDGDDPREIPEAFVWPSVLQMQLHANVGSGRFCLGRLGQGVAKPGQSAPWKLAEATDKDRAAARAYLNGLNVVTLDSVDDDDPPPWEKKK